MDGYNAAFAAFYDSLIGDVDYGARADFYLNQSKRFKDRCKLVLDLACGTGTLATELSLRGCEVIGVDGSADMLMHAQAKNEGLTQPVLYLCQALEQLDLYGTVELAISMQDSLNHLHGSLALQRAFERLAFFVEPGGLFFFDMNTPYKHREVLGDNTFVFDTGDVYCVWQNEYDPRSGSVSIELDFFERQPDGGYRRSCESFCEYSYTIGEVKRMLERTGFELLEVQGDYTGQPPTECEERLVYLARRKPLQELHRAIPGHAIRRKKPVEYGGQTLWAAL